MQAVLGAGGFRNDRACMFYRTFLGVGAIPGVHVLPPHRSKFTHRIVSRETRWRQAGNRKTRKWLRGRQFSESSDLSARFGCWMFIVGWFGGSTGNCASNRKTRNSLWCRSFSVSSESGAPWQSEASYCEVCFRVDPPLALPPAGGRRKRFVFVRSISALLVVIAFSSGCLGLCQHDLRWFSVQGHHVPGGVDGGRICFGGREEGGGGGGR